MTSELLCGPPGDTALLGDGPPPVRLSWTRRGMSSADLAMLLPRPRADLALPGEPLDVLGTGRLECPDLGVVAFFILLLVPCVGILGPLKKKILYFIFLSQRHLIMYVIIIYSSRKYHQGNMSVQYIPPTPLLYSKTGVCWAIPIFLILAPKHRLWVLVRTASPRRF